jgi:hypothetical protein
MSITRGGVKMDAFKNKIAIIRGVERNQATIVVTWFAKVLWILQRISPGLIRWMMGRDLRKTRKEMRIGD